MTTLSALVSDGSGDPSFPERPFGTKAGPDFSFDSLPSYVITLTEAQFDDAKARLEEAGFGNLHRFVGINGKDKRLEITNDRSKLTYRAETEIIYANTREAHSSMPSWGGVGCYLSHVGTWEEAAKSPYGILIFEADVKPKPGARKAFEEKFMALVSHHNGQLPDLLFMSGFGKSPRVKNDTPDGISRLTDRKYGAEAYYISPAGAQKLLKDAFPMEVQVDSYIGYKILRGMEPSVPPQETLGAYITDVYLAVQENLEGTSIQTKPVKEASIYDNEVMVWFCRAIVLVILIFSGLFIAEYRRVYWSKNNARR